MTRGIQYKGCGYWQLEAHKNDCLSLRVYTHWQNTMSRSSSPGPSSISSKSSSPQRKVLDAIASQMAVPPPPPVYVRRAKPGEIKAQPQPKGQAQSKRPPQPKHEMKRAIVDKYREDVRKSHNRQSRLHAYIAEDGEVEDDAQKLLEAVAPRPRTRPYSTAGPNYSRDSLVTISTTSTPRSSMVRLGTFPEAEEYAPKESSSCCGCIDFKAWFKCKKLGYNAVLCPKYVLISIPLGLCNSFSMRRAPKPTPNILLTENRYSSTNLPIFLEPTLQDSDFRVKVHLASRTNSSSSLETIV
ncbi:hypothetical protein BJ165DRAFT_566698 [Panaeolus papilionaceus]|nr:hypothetical protein BJ165DRAFT_566698 [Panaeolus papilionaceus]